MQTKNNYRWIIFLDIDGVLNCHLHYQSDYFSEMQKKINITFKSIQPKDVKRLLKQSVKKRMIDRVDFYKAQISPERIELLNDLCIKINADVVISSTWRLNKTVNELQQIMDSCGATFSVIDKTCHTGYERGTEISKWIAQNIKPETHGCYSYGFERYVIIDDDSDMLLNQREHFFQTNNYSGLTMNTTYNIENFVNKFNKINGQCHTVK